jgi:hypothetical protein
MAERMADFDIPGDSAGAAGSPVSSTIYLPGTTGAPMNGAANNNANKKETRRLLKGILRIYSYPAKPSKVPASLLDGKAGCLRLHTVQRHYDRLQAARRILRHAHVHLVQPDIERRQPAE